MKTVLYSNEMQTCDYNTINYYKINSEILMERAALAVSEEMSKYIDITDKILVFVGNGNNGGDGVAVARILNNLGYDTSILLCGEEDKFSEQLKKQLIISRQYDIKEISKDNILDYNVLVDGIFGIGLSRDIKDKFSEYIDLYNESKALKFSIDIPSGINANNGQVMGVSCKSDVTITFNFLKPGHLLYPGREFSGNTFVYDIGINENSFLNDVNPDMYCFEKDDLMLLNNRKTSSNKGDYGKILIIAGSKGMSGSAYFSAASALRMGAGLVKVYTTEDNREIIQKKLPEAIVSAYTNYDEKGLLKELEWSNVCVLGPGIGTSVLSRKIVDFVITNYSKNLILDADALNIISKNISLIKKNNCKMILTPHLGEMSRLIGKNLCNIKDDNLEIAKEFAKKYNLILCMKDAATIVASDKTYINTSGNNGMSTAGSGDVLTGIIAGVIGNGIEPHLAAPLGVYIHGLCGDMANLKLGAHSMLASDIIDSISLVLKEGI